MKPYVTDHRNILLLSSLERESLDYLYEHGLHLPDRAQFSPAQGVASQPDFYHERDGRPGICVFVDGSVHGGQVQAQRDAMIRDALEDLGYRVLAIRYDRSVESQIEPYADVFKRGV